MAPPPPLFQKSVISLDIIIVGAGLAGLAAAIGLCRVGHKVTVHERSTELREIGAGIQLPANSSRILDDLGVLGKIKSYAVQPHDLTIRSYRGQKLYHQEMGPDIQERFQYPHLVIHRANLRRVLYEEAQTQGAIIHLGSCVSGIDFSAPKAMFPNGESHSADLILGADGEHSICRQLLLGQSYAPTTSGDTVYRISVPVSKIAAEASLAHLVEKPSIHAWYGPRSHAVCYRLLRDGVFNIVLTLPEAKGSPILGPQAGDLDFVRGACREWNLDFRTLLDLADGTVKWTLLEAEELNRWVDPLGRFALLGDSAHATLPYLAQGAAMSLESALTLTTLLQNISNRAHLYSILRLYEMMRIPRAHNIRRRSKFMRDTCQMEDGPAQVERDRVLLEDQPGDGFPNPWADPCYQKWMWGFDARQEAERLWTAHKEEIQSQQTPRMKRKRQSRL